MIKIGLTGSPASGKTTVLKMLAAKGARIFDSDRLIDQIYNNPEHPAYKRLAEFFPDSFREERVIREKLAVEVFENKEKLRNLEEVIHPVVIRALRQWLEAEAKEKVSVAEVPLLFEKELEELFDKVILVDCRESILFKRLEEKCGLGKEAIRQRLSLFLPPGEKRKKCNFILTNNTDFNKLKKEVDSLWQKIGKI